jgi:hypothetical protein
MDFICAISLSINKISTLEVFPSKYTCPQKYLKKLKHMIQFLRKLIAIKERKSQVQLKEKILQSNLYESMNCGHI